MLYHHHLDCRGFRSARLAQVENDAKVRTHVFVHTTVHQCKNAKHLQISSPLSFSLTFLLPSHLSLHSKQVSLFCAGCGGRLEGSCRGPAVIGDPALAEAQHCSMPALFHSHF